MPLKGTQGSPYPYRSNRAVSVGRRNIQRDQSATYHQSWGGPRQFPVNTPVAAAAANDILTTTAGPNTATISPALNGTLVSGGIATLIPLYGPYTGSRNVVVTVTHATSIVAVSGTITGIDVYGRVMAESWSVTATGTSKTYTTKKCFKYVTAVTITAAGDASADSITVGDGVVFGLDVRCSVAAGDFEVVDATVVTTGTFVAYDPVNSGLSTAFSADMRGTYAPSAAPNGTHVYDVWIQADDPEFSDEGYLEK